MAAAHRKSENDAEWQHRAFLATRLSSKMIYSATAGRFRNVTTDAIAPNEPLNSTELYSGDS
jgi:hypothetical protein